MVAGSTICLLTWTGTFTPPNVPLFAIGRVLLSNPSLIVGTPMGMAHSWFHSCHVVQSAGQLQVNWLLPATSFSLVSSWLGGHAADCRRVAGIDAVCEQGYWMHEVSCYHGSHIGCQFLSWVLFLGVSSFYINFTCALGPQN